MSAKMRRMVALQPHVMRAALQKCADHGLDFSAVVSLALTSWGGPTAGGLQVEPGYGPELMQPGLPPARRGRPPTPPPPLPTLQRVIEGLIQAKWLPPGSLSLQWEATWGPTDLTSGLNADMSCAFRPAHPDVVCWGLSIGHGYVPNSSFSSPQDGAEPWLEIDGVRWHMPELIWTLTHGRPPTGKLSKNGKCHEASHTCWRPDHYTPGTKWFRFWKD